MGLRSAIPVTGEHFGTGVIIAVRQAAGTTPVPMDMFIILGTTNASSPAQSRYTQYGMLSKPGDVLLILDNKISISSIV